MSAHSDNSIKIHSAGRCTGKLQKSIVDKGDLGKFELYTCSNKRCTYVGRGKQLTAEDLAKLEPKPVKVQQESENPFGSKRKK